MRAANGRPYEDVQNSIVGATIGRPFGRKVTSFMRGGSKPPPYEQRAEDFATPLYPKIKKQERQPLLFYHDSLFDSLKLSAIIAINSLFVGLPRLFWIV